MRIATSHRSAKRALAGIAGTTSLLAILLIAHGSAVQAQVATNAPAAPATMPIPASSVATLPMPVITPPATSSAKTTPLTPAPTVASLPAPMAPHAPAAPLMPASSVMPSMPPLIAPAAAATPGEGEAEGADKSQIARETASNEKRMVEAAKGMVKHLDTSSDAMTLQDLNTARQTVARLEAIIEVEKKLAEIDKIRNERAGNEAKKDTSRSLANAIPASALAPLPTANFAMRRPPAPVINHPIEVVNRNPTPVVKEKPKLISTNMEISRISGSDGKYVAVIRMPDGETRTVRDGDHIADGVTVRWVNSTGMGIEEGGSTHTLHIRNVETIFSAMR